MFHLSFCVIDVFLGCNVSRHYVELDCSICCCCVFVVVDSMLVLRTLALVELGSGMLSQNTGSFLVDF